MTETWRADLSRDGNGNLITVAPETAPEWVGDLIGDVIYRFRDTPDALHIVLAVTGEHTHDDAPQPTAPLTPDEPAPPFPEDTPDAAPDAAGGADTAAGLPQPTLDPGPQHAADPDAAAPAADQP
jgi:hypothetical protein